MSSRHLIIMRGLPGSGKSTWVEAFEKKWDAEHPLGDSDSSGDSTPVLATISADEYWIRPDGKYDCNPELFGAAHAWCRSRVENAMLPMLFDDDGDPEDPENRLCEPCECIIVDNTNTRKSHWMVYVNLAEKHGYEVSFQCRS